MKRRYIKRHYWNEKPFKLNYFEPTDEDAKDLLVKILEQALRDYKRLFNSENLIEQELFETARGFLFDPEYRIDFGDYELGLDEVTTHLGLDADWLRRRLTEKQKVGKNQ